MGQRRFVCLGRFFIVEQHWPDTKRGSTLTREISRLRVGLLKEKFAAVQLGRNK